MKKTSKLVPILLATSFFGIAVPANTNLTLPERKTLEELSLESSLERNYSSSEISQIIKDVYKHFPRKPDYFSEKFVREIAMHESSYDTRAVSKKGARGLMQIMPDTWPDFDREHDFYVYAFDPKLNVEVGIRKLLWIGRTLKEKYGGWEELPAEEKRKMVLASYNAGLLRFEEQGWELEKMPRETRNYVEGITSGLKE